MHFKVYFHDTGLQSFLNLHDCLVVNRGADLFQEEPKQGTGCDISNLLIHVFLEVTLNRSDGLLLVSLDISMVMRGLCRNLQ
jgi:hypothetical protein